MSVFPVCMYVYHIHPWYPQKSEEGIKFPGTGVTVGWEPRCGCWEPNPVPLEEQSVLLFTEPSLQHFPLFISFAMGSLIEPDQLWSASSRDPSVSSPLVLGSQTCTTMPGLYTGARDQLTQEAFVLSRSPLQPQKIPSLNKNHIQTRYWICQSDDNPTPWGVAGVLEKASACLCVHARAPLKQFRAAGAVESRGHVGHLLETQTEP